MLWNFLYMKLKDKSLTELIMEQCKKKKEHEERKIEHLCSIKGLDKAT